MDSSNSPWLDETRTRIAAHRAHVDAIATSTPLEGDRLASLDSTLKHAVTFTRKTKTLGTAPIPASLFNDLERFNLLKFLDEIASNICELKCKNVEVSGLVAFVVKLRCLYPQIEELLITELKKHIPHRKADKIENPTKLRIDLRFLGELILSGVIGKPGLDLLGGALNYLVNTDTDNFSNALILMPFCRTLLFDFLGIVPLSEKEQANLSDEAIAELVSPILTDANRKVLRGLLEKYCTSYVSHLNSVRVKMNKVRKSIKRQERTKGDASPADRQKYDEYKALFDKLLTGAADFAECLGVALPPMDEEPSDDESEAVKQLGGDQAEVRASLWPDRDSATFYEDLIDIGRFVPMKPIGSEPDPEPEPETVDEAPPNTEATLNENVDAVDFSELEDASSEGDAHTTSIEEEIVETEADATAAIVDASTAPAERSLDPPQFIGNNMNDFLDNLSSALNRELINRAAEHFVAVLNGKTHRKRLVHHFLNSPRDRLDLVPFYGRFIATVKAVLPDVAKQVVNEILLAFRNLATAKIDTSKTKDKTQPRVRKYEEGVFISRFLAEFIKFKLLPKAEALSCLRSLLVDLRNYKVDMLCALVESAGYFLYHSPDTHAKMKVVLSVIQRKLSILKDARQKLLLENAYFTVLPSDENTSNAHNQDPMKSFISLVIRGINGSSYRVRDPVAILAGLDWSNEELVNYLITELSDVCSIRYDNLADVADLVRSLMDYQGDTLLELSVFVTDSVLETIRIALESPRIAHQQRLYCSVQYLMWLYVCGVCDFRVFIQVLYQLIKLGLPPVVQATPEQLLRRNVRIRYAAEAVANVFEYVDPGFSRQQLDNFVHYLLNFYYSTKEMWEDFTEELGDYPLIVGDAVEAMLKAVSGKKNQRRYKFATDLVTSQKTIAALEKRYKAEVQKQVAQGRKVFATNENAGLDSIREEDEESVENEDEEEVSGEEYEEEEEEESDGDDIDEEDNYVNAGDPEQVRVHIDRKELDSHDADFDREFERIMAESLQSVSMQSRQPLDLTVPPSARQKFERKVKFGVLDTEKEAFDPATLIAAPSTRRTPDPPIQMALMTRGKGQKPILKSVQLDVSQSMKDTWAQVQRQTEKERNLVKTITLQLNDRIQQRGDDDPALDPNMSRFITPQANVHDCHIPAGPGRNPGGR